MPRIRDILPAVLAQRSDIIDQALSAALPHAGPDEVGQLGLAMLQRGKANGVESLISEYQRLPAAVQHQLVARAEQFSTSIRRAATRRGAVASQNALTIIEKAASTRLAYLVTSLCRHSDAAVRAQAGTCIIALANRCASSQQPGQQPHMDAVSTRFLIDAVEQAIVQYSRHDDPALLAAMLCLMPRALPEARAALTQPEHSSIEAMNHYLRTRPAISEACRDALADANANQKLAEPLELGHLLALPNTRQALLRSRHHDTLWPDARQQHQMPPVSRRWLPAYLAALTNDPQEQVNRLGPLAKHTDTATRLAVLRRLLVLAKPKTPEDQPAANHANDTLALLTRDPEPAIARTALWHLIRIDYAGLPRILADLVNSRHPTIRKVAAKHLAPLGFDRYWDAWPKLDRDRRIAAGRALIKIDNDLHRHLATRLAAHDPEARLRALAIIATLNQGTFFEEVLLHLCASDDPRIVASAVKALAGCTSEATRQTLQLALEHNDNRIRANALEALDHTQATANLDKLLAMTRDNAQRPRANAIKALMELRAKDALPSLTRMLSDQRPEHRVSALWLIDEMGVLQLARLVAEMSLTDQDKNVKQRAGTVIQHLISDLEQQAGAQEQPPLADATPTEAA